MVASPTSLPRALAEVVSRGELVVPAYPAAALRLQRLVNSGNFGLSEVAEAASADPALAAALLRTANSALYQGSGPVITNLGRAVHRLGARVVATVAVAAGLSASATSPGPLVDVKYRVWRRSVTCALACQKLAALRGLDPEEAFLAGLLHGFGRSVALGCLERLLPSLPQQSMSLIEWMNAVEPHRGELARVVAERWQLPAVIALAIGVPAANGAASPVRALVELGEHLAEALERGAAAEQIALTRGVAANERRAVDEFVAGLASAIDALIEAPDPSKRPRGAGSSAVSKPATALAGELRPVSLPVVDLRMRRDPVEVPAVGCVQEGLVLDSPRPMQESCVVRLGLGSGADSIEGWFSVVLCTPERGRYRVEVVPFAASRELRKFLADKWSAR